MNKNLVKATQFQAFTILLDCMRQTDKATKYGILIPLPYSKWRSKFFYNFTIVFVLYSQVTFETNYLFFSLNVLRMVSIRSPYLLFPTINNVNVANVRTYEDGSPFNARRSLAHCLTTLFQLQRQSEM